jgi:hypothetical protein
MKQEPKPIDFSKLEDWESQPWKSVGLTMEQWVRPLSELPAEHRKIIFDVYNSKYKLNFSPNDFGL